MYNPKTQQLIHLEDTEIRKTFVKTRVKHEYTIINETTHDLSQIR